MKHSTASANPGPDSTGPHVMRTRRINVYRSGAGILVYFVEEYNPEHNAWYTVGETYDVYEHAAVSIELANAREVMKVVKYLPEYPEEK